MNFKDTGKGKKNPKLGGEAQKSRWLRQIDAHEGMLLSRKELAGILGVSPSKIRNDNEKDRLDFVKMGPEGSKAPVFIPKPDAKQYVKKFFTSTLDETPPTRLLFKESELRECGK